MPLRKAGEDCASGRIVWPASSVRSGAADGARGRPRLLPTGTGGRTRVASSSPGGLAAGSTGGAMRVGAAGPAVPPGLTMVISSSATGGRAGRGGSGNSDAAAAAAIARTTDVSSSGFGTYRLRTTVLSGSCPAASIVGTGLPRRPESERVPGDGGRPCSTTA